MPDPKKKKKPGEEEEEKEKKPEGGFEKTLSDWMNGDDKKKKS